MHLTRSDVPSADAQRLVNFCAQHNHQTFAIAGAFVDQVAAEFPSFRAALPLNTKRQRHDLGQVVADFARAFACPEIMNDSCARAGRALARCGMTRENLPTLRTALLASLRRHAASDWTHDVENAWVNAVDTWMGMAVESLAPSAGACQPARTRKAA